MICHFWLQGRCNNGEQCRFAHTAEVPPNGGPPPGQGGDVPICSYFVAGYCSRGDACYYRHENAVGCGKGKGCGRGKGKSKGKACGGKGYGKGPFRNLTLDNTGKGPSYEQTMDGSPPPVPGVGGQGEERSLTGPYLGKGSELLKAWVMPDDQGHEDGVAAAVRLGDRICTGGLDQKLLLWKGDAGVAAAGGGLALVQDGNMPLPAPVCSMVFHAESAWLFCGLLDGSIKALRQQPAAEDTLSGHTGAVNALLFHEGVLLSGSEDATVRVWRCDAGPSKWACAATINNTVGPVFAMHLQLPQSIWIGSQEGINCVSVANMQSLGTMKSQSAVVAMLPYESCVLAVFSDGVVKAYDGAGAEKFSHGPLGEHITNTAAALVKHPSGKTLILCGQELGYITAYEVPEFKPRGTFTTGYHDDVSSIIDMGDGVFLTCSFSGDVIIWRWQAPGAV
eukprot:TRINITY_DN3766_c0_g3_i1.p1 TRINITY_DN3766_c0_g3~~TRINITY_DN3766_c0_g3_i1.p1  ORF type:complete len:450 (-),score=99.30 TRINITY_DN3766_c0_g3_i1:84-1433(-)